MLSVVIHNKVLDFKFKKISKDHYVFYIGDILVGQIFNYNKAWTVVSQIPNKLCPVYGFKTRTKAAEFLLKLNNYTT